VNLRNDLRGANLTNAHFTGGDLTGADLKGAIFRNTLMSDPTVGDPSATPCPAGIAWAGPTESRPHPREGSGPVVAPDRGQLPMGFKWERSAPWTLEGAVDLDQRR